MQQTPFDTKNLIIAIAISIVIVLGFEFFYNRPNQERQRALQAERALRDTPTQTVPGTAPGTAPATPGTAPTATTPTLPIAAAPRTRDEVARGQQRVRIETPAVAGSILLRGARIDDLTLRNYRETVEANSPPITLLAPDGTANPYFADFGWIGTGVALPDANSEWTADAPALTPQRPVTLSWANGQGLTFERRIAIDEHYMFTVTDRVVNRTGAPVELRPYARAVRVGTPHVSGFYILHEGPIGVLGGSLRELGYSDLQSRQTIAQDTTGGWIGITDKYWLVALIPEQERQEQSRFLHRREGGQDVYQVDFTAPNQAVAPGATLETTHRLFAGAKEVRLLDRYAAEFNIPLFDRAIDFGWFYWITRPMFLILVFFNQLLGNFGLAILLLTVLIKAAFFPLANKSYRAMSKMKLLQPEIEKIKERVGDDRQKLSQEMMALYKKSGANPLAGCLPVVIQIPVFFALYKVLFNTLEMRHAPFFGWIHDLSAPDPTSVFNLFGLLPFAPPEVALLGFTLGAWPLIMGATMFLQQRLNPQPADPVQAKMFMFMPILFTFMLAGFASGLVIYWAWNNILSVTQQWVIMRRVTAEQSKPHDAKT